MKKFLIAGALFFATQVSATTLQWDYPYNLHDGFVIYRREATGTLFTEIGRTDKSVLTFVDPDTSKLYCYFVKAVSGPLFSTRSNVRCTVPNPPVGLVVSQ